MTTQEKIAVMQAYVDGKQIQGRLSKGDWEDFDMNREPVWLWGRQDYRIKPEPKKPIYRPYKDFAEFRNEWEKHRGWMVDKCGQYVLHTVYNEKTAEYVLEKYVWADDETPCGIKEED